MRSPPFAEKETRLGARLPRPALTGDPRPRVAERAAARSREASSRTEPLGICKGRGGGRRRRETGLPPQGARRAGTRDPHPPLRVREGQPGARVPRREPARGEARRPRGRSTGRRALWRGERGGKSGVSSGARYLERGPEGRGMSAGPGVSTGPGVSAGPRVRRVGWGRAGDAQRMARPRGRRGWKRRAAGLPRRVRAGSCRRRRYLCGASGSRSAASRAPLPPPAPSPARVGGSDRNSVPGALGASAGREGRAVVLPCGWGWRGRREDPRTRRESPHRHEWRTPSPRRRPHAC